jgi:hypothetical protein
VARKYSPVCLAGFPHLSIAKTGAGGVDLTQGGVIKSSIFMSEAYIHQERGAKTKEI